MRVVLCNISVGKADELAAKLVEERLAACVNILAVRSVYRWRGAIEVEPEETLLIKTRAERLDALRDRIVELHPYELPEVVVLDVDTETSLAAYVDWVRAETA